MQHRRSSHSQSFGNFSNRNNNHHHNHHNHNNNNSWLYCMLGRNTSHLTFHTPLVSHCPSSRLFYPAFLVHLRSIYTQDWRYKSTHLSHSTLSMELCISEHDEAGRDVATYVSIKGSHRIEFIVRLFQFFSIHPPNMSDWSPLDYYR